MSKTRPVAALLAYAAFGLLVSATAVARTWTDSTGQHTVEAEFVSLENGVVSLKKGNGSTVSVPLDKLCKADQLQAKRLLAAQQAPVKPVEVETPKKDSAASSAPADHPDPTPTRGMTESLDVDLRADSQKNFQVGGPVEFKTRRLTVGPAGSVTRSLDLGSQAKLTLLLTFTALSADGQTSTTRFAFQIRDRGEFVVLFVRHREKGKTVGELQFVDQDTPYLPNGGLSLVKMTRTLRTITWEGDFPDGPWTFGHNHGLLTVYRGNKQMGVAYADKEPKALAFVNEAALRFQQLPGANYLFHRKFAVGEPLELSGWSLEQEGAPIVCLGISGNASPSYRQGQQWKAFEDFLARQGPRANDAGSLSPNLRLRIAQPIAYYLEYLDSHADNRQGLETESALLNIRSCLGERHAFVALVLEAQAMQMHWAGKSAEAAELLNRAIAISEESLGPLHPDHASALSALGNVYREVGKLDRAEPLLLQARQAVLEVFGAHSGRYAVATRDLALLYQDTGRMAEAETILRSATEADDDASLLDRAESLPALLLLAEVDDRMGERDKAEGLLQQAGQQTFRELLQAGESPQPTETWQQCEQRMRITRTLAVELARAQTAVARNRLRNSEYDDARRFAHIAFLNMVRFYKLAQGTYYDTRFQGWESRMTNVQVNEVLAEHPAYGRVVIALAELFADLGDEIPALRCVEVADRIAGVNNRELAVLCRTMSKIYEANPRGTRTIITSAETPRSGDGWRIFTKIGLSLRRLAKSTQDHVRHATSTGGNWQRRNSRSLPARNTRTRSTSCRPRPAASGAPTVPARRKQHCATPAIAPSTCPTGWWLGYRKRKRICFSKPISRRPICCFRAFAPCKRIGRTTRTR